MMKKSQGIWIGIGLALAIAVVLMWVLRPQPHPYAQLDGDPILAKIAEANGSLEDQDRIVDVPTKRKGFDVAEQLYRELRQELPNELLPLRNLAVLRASEALAEANAAEDRQSFLAESEALLTELGDREGQEAVAEYLRSRMLFRLAGEIASQPALDAINRALELEPNRAMYWGWKVALLEIIRDDEPQRQEWLEQRHVALEKAWSLDSSNVYLLAQSLVDLASRKDPGIAERIKEAKELVAVLRYPVLIDNPRTDPFVYLDRLQSEVEQGDWDAAIASASFAFNLMKNSLGIYNLDSNRATGHPLDLMLHRPSEEFFEHVKLAQYQAPQAQMQWSAKAALATLEEPALDVVVTDVNVDRHQDLVVLTSQRLVVMLADGDGNLADRLELTFDSPGSYQRVLACDLDQDDSAKANGSSGGDTMGGPEESIDYFLADPDFVLWGTGGVSVVLNQDELGRDRRLEQVELPEDFESGAAVSATAIFDLDLDADLDLLIATPAQTHLLLNRGSGTFLNGTQFVEQTAGLQGISSLCVVDWDRDLDLDVITATGTEVGILENLLQGRLRHRPLTEVPAATQPVTALALEADGHPSWDLALGQGAQDSVLVTTQTHQSKVTQAAVSPVEFSWTSRARFEDLDNDGVQDSIDMQAGKLTIAQGQATGGFEAATIVDVGAPIAGFEVIDWDDDGRLDIILAGDDGISWLKNSTATSSGWVCLQLIGDQQNTGRIPRDAFGSLAEIDSHGRYQAKVVRGQRTHFGLGSREQIAAVRVIWSNGMPQAIISPEKNTSLFFPIYLKGSCPFLYTWDGEKFVFVTDCLWAAPLGLLRSKTELMPSREWEYLKVPGEMLKRNEQGKYVIQLTEELWESAYFDQVELIAVDHSADVEIYSNEKVGPPSIAQFKVHTVAQRRAPVSATGTRGEDVLSLVAQADDDYYRGFQRRVVQGLVDEHWLELDLGDLSDAREVMLFLTGWIHPTDTSLNVSFTDHPDRFAPRPPEIWVVNEQGEWVRWDAPIGFPGGKTKTIAVDLSALCPRPDGRLRIVTTAEIYWDEAFFTVDQAPEEIRQFPMRAESADLHYRGFSARLPQQPNQPERFDYQQVTRDPVWAPMQGRFTRYGNVTELLLATDDRMVVMGSGDEMTVTFEPLSEDPPEGWTRDFLLHSVGWDKDADLNTILGQDTEPLPYAGMQLYPYSDREKDWNAGELADYFSSYQTRTSEWSRFWKSGFWKQVSELPAADSVQ